MISVPVKFHRDLSYLTMSDLHAGHPRLRTNELVNHLDWYFGNYSPTHAFTNLDIIFIAGDLFDSALNFRSEDVLLITRWLGSLMQFCSTHSIKLRILEGTPSHDNKQSRISNIVFDLLNVKLDFKYVETLYIEQMEDIGLSVLYMPDEWAGSTAKAQKQVEEMMAEMHLDKVDIACMHGMFRYQVPMQANESLKHNEEFYLGIVRFFINIGHIHTHSTLERIIAQGSFDRMSHGEEEAKGATICYIRKEGDHGFVFLENKHAKIFKTVHVKHLDIDKAVKQITKVADSLPDRSYLRIKAKAGHPVLNVINELKLRYPFINFTKVTEEDDREATMVVKEVTGLEDDYIPISITKENVVPLLKETITHKYTLTGDQQRRLDQILLKAHL